MTRQIDLLDEIDGLKARLLGAAGEGGKMMATRGVRGVAVGKDSILVVDGVCGSSLIEIGRAHV